MRRLLIILLCLSHLLSACGGDAGTDISAVLSETAAVLLEQVPEPGCASVGGEWTVLGMARMGGEVPDGWFEGYRQRLEEHVTACGGVLHDRKYTEYSRVILAVTAMGGDARDVAGYDLTAPLSDTAQTVFQGINGAIYALLALDSGSYAGDDLRLWYVDHILERELPGGGWSMMGAGPEPDLTAMALQALAKHRDRADVSAAVERGLDALSGVEFTTSESISQTIVALCELGIPADDRRFVREGKTLPEQLLSYRTDDGMFRHTMETEGDLLATEQAFCALVSLNLAGQTPGP